jgi:RNA polymerase sigma-70 factor (ECF subfamily)
MDEKTILQLLWDRAESAIPALQKTFGKGLYRLAMNILGSHSDAEETVSDTYFALWNAIPPQRPEPLAPYVYRTGKNIALNVLRSKGAQKRGGYVLSLDELSDCVSAPTADRELGDGLNQWLSRLKQADKAVFLRRYWFGDSVKDIARSLHMTENSVSVRLHRLRNDLKAYLTKEGYYDQF